jgi:CRP-like cAMP-binding protein
MKQRDKYLKFLHTVNFIRTFYSRGWLSNNRLEDLADALRPRYYTTNQIVIEQGDTNAYEMFFIEHGSVRVTRKEPDGHVRELKVLQAGKCFGELALLENKPRYATVTAREPCRLATLDAQAFENLLGIELKTKLKEFVDREYSTGTFDDPSHTKR